MAHQASLKTDRSVADFSLDLGTRGQRGDGVDDDGIDGAGTHEHVNDLERLLTRIGLGNEHLVDIHADARGIRGIERVLGIDKCHNATHCLGLGQDLERKRRLTGGLGTVDLDDSAARHAADTQRGIEGQGAVGMASTSSSGPPSPYLMMEPWPNFFSISALVVAIISSRSLPVVRA